MIVRRMFTNPAWGWRSPFEELEEMRRRVERLGAALMGEGVDSRAAGVYPLVNVTEDGDNYWLRAELPGVSVEDLDISVTGKSLAITGERRIAGEDESAKYHRKERESGSFSRMIDLPNLVDGEKVEAKLLNGVLTVRLPKAESAKPRQIKIS